MQELVLRNAAFTALLLAIFALPLQCTERRRMESIGDAGAIDRSRSGSVTKLRVTNGPPSAIACAKPGRAMKSLRSADLQIPPYQELLFPFVVGIGILLDLLDSNE